MVSSHKVYVNGLSAEAAIVQIIRSWAIAHPDELVCLDRYVKAFRDNLINGKAITRKGNMLYKAEIPMTLYCMMQHRFGNQWTRDKSLFNLFLRNFQVGLINRTSEVNPKT